MKLAHNVYVAMAKKTLYGPQHAATFGLDVMVKKCANLAFYVFFDIITLNAHIFQTLVTLSFVVRMS